MKNTYLDRLRNLINSKDKYNEFNEFSFVPLLFSLLYKNGVNKINQSHLMKQLFTYYQNEEYQFLFKNMYATKTIYGSNIDEIDIHTGIKTEKTYGDNIKEDMEQRNKLNIQYDNNVDDIVEHYSRYLNEEDFILMKKMVKELAIINKVEENSLYETLIISENPNNIYELNHGKDTFGRVLRFELLTDGDIESIYYHDSKEIANCYFNSPLELDSMLKLKNAKCINILLRHSSYAIMQGLCDDDIKYSIVYTKLLEENILNKISTIAGTRHYGEALTKDEPYVRKLVLK